MSLAPSSAFRSGHCTCAVPVVPFWFDSKSLWEWSKRWKVLLGVLVSNSSLIHPDLYLWIYCHCSFLQPLLSIMNSMLHTISPDSSKNTFVEQVWNLRYCNLCRSLKGFNGKRPIFATSRYHMIRACLNWIWRQYCGAQNSKGWASSATLFYLRDWTVSQHPTLARSKSHFGQSTNTGKQLRRHLANLDFALVGIALPYLHRQTNTGWLF